MCHSTAKAELLSVGTTSIRVAGASVHRKRLTLTAIIPPPMPQNSTHAFANPAVPSVVITPQAGERIRLFKLTINATAAYTGTVTIKDGATTIQSFTVNYTAGGNDVDIEFPGDGLLSTTGQALTIAGPAASVANTVTYNVTAESHPEEGCRVTLSPENPVTISKGFSLMAGNDPICLTENELGDWLQRDLFIVSNVAITVSVVDIAEIGKRQGSPHHEIYLDAGDKDRHNPHKGY